MEPFNLARQGACTLQVITASGGKIGISVTGAQKDENDLPYFTFDLYSLNSERHEAQDGAKLRLAKVDGLTDLDELTRERVEAGATVNVAEGVCGVLNPGGDGQIVRFQVREAKTA